MKKIVNSMDNILSPLKELFGDVDIAGTIAVISIFGIMAVVLLLAVTSFGQ